MPKYRDKMRLNDLLLKNSEVDSLTRYLILSGYPVLLRSLSEESTLFGITTRFAYANSGIFDKNRSGRSHIQAAHNRNRSTMWCIHWWYKEIWKGNSLVAFSTTEERFELTELHEYISRNWFGIYKTRCMFIEAKIFGRNLFFKNWVENQRDRRSVFPTGVGMNR